MTFGKNVNVWKEGQQIEMGKRGESEGGVKKRREGARKQNL